MSSEMNTDFCKGMVISIEYAKDLKKLGVPQESAFYWHETKIGYRVISTRRFAHPFDSYSAFTSAEICQYLFRYTSKIHQILDKKNVYIIRAPALKMIEFEDMNQQDACVKMLIHFLERKMIKL